MIERRLRIIAGLQVAVEVSAFDQTGPSWAWQVQIRERGASRWIKIKSGRHIGSAGDAFDAAFDAVPIRRWDP